MLELGTMRWYSVEVGRRDDLGNVSQSRRFGESMRRYPKPQFPRSLGHEPQLSGQSMQCAIAIMSFARHHYDQDLYAISRCFDSFPLVSSPSRLRALLPMSATPYTSAPFVATDNGNCCSQRHNLLTLHMVASDRSRNFQRKAASPDTPINRQNTLP